MAPNHDPDLALALRLADVADEVTMSHFRSTSLAHERKADGLPVSEADRACEEAIRAVLAAERPGDLLLGEEVGGPAEPGGRRWVVDGIDGTVSFLAGGRGWATQIALEVDGAVVVGVCSAPAVGMRFWGSAGGGAFADGSPLRVSTTAAIAGARWSTIDVSPAQAPVLERLGASPAAGHPALEVATGAADVGFVGSIGGWWDLASFVGIVEGAGGRFADLGGGSYLFSNGVLLDAAVDAYRTGTTSTTAL